MSIALDHATLFIFWHNTNHKLSKHQTANNCLFWSQKLSCLVFAVLSTPLHVFCIQCNHVVALLLFRICTKHMDTAFFDKPANNTLLVVCVCVFNRVPSQQRNTTTQHNRCMQSFARCFLLFDCFDKKAHKKRRKEVVMAGQRHRMTATVGTATKTSNTNK